MHNPPSTTSGVAPLLVQLCGSTSAAHSKVVHTGWANPIITAWQHMQQQSHCWVAVSVLSLEDAQPMRTINHIRVSSRLRPPQHQETRRPIVCPHVLGVVRHRSSGRATHLYTHNLLHQRFEFVAPQGVWVHVDGLRTQVNAVVKLADNVVKQFSALSGKVGQGPVVRDSLKVQGLHVFRCFRIEEQARNKQWHLLWPAPSKPSHEARFHLNRHPDARKHTTALEEQFLAEPPPRPSIAGNQLAHYSTWTVSNDWFCALSVIGGMRSECRATAASASALRRLHNPTWSCGTSPTQVYSKARPTRMPCIQPPGHVYRLNPNSSRMQWLVAGGS